MTNHNQTPEWLTAEGILRNTDRTAASFYAWGRADAGDRRGVDALDFAEHYARIAARHRAGLRDHRPSIQDAWTAYAERIAGAVK